MMPFHGKPVRIVEGRKVDGRGKHMKHCISADKFMEVRNHIESFPTVNSHYCRAKTNKQYVESHLNQLKMYDLYVENCRKENKDPISLSYYRNVFNTDFNTGFHMPKSDRWLTKCLKPKLSKSLKRWKLLKSIILLKKRLCVVIAMLIDKIRLNLLYALIWKMS